MKATKHMITYALVTHDGWDYKVHENGLVEQWMVADDCVSGEWATLPASDEFHLAIQQAGLVALVSLAPSYSACQD